MFRGDDLLNAGFLSILFADGQEPLTFWDKQVRSGRIKRMREETDKDRFQFIEITGLNVNSTFISSPPPGHRCLGITLPVLVLIVKNLKKYFCFEVQVLDDRNFRRRFRLTNIPGFQRRQATISTCPIILEEGWNELSVNLSELCTRFYGTQYVETIRIEIHANCRLREVFFCERFDAMKSRAVKHLPAADQFNVPIISGSSRSEHDNNNYEKGPVDSMYRKYDQLAKDKENEITDAYGHINDKLDKARRLLRRKSITGKSKEETVKSENSETTSSTYLSLGERLKREMYFEKPDSSSINRSQPPSSISKSNKK